MRFITKTIYLQYLACAKNTWLRLNKPELSSMFELSEFDKSLVAKGNLVESWARKLFPEGILISEFGEEAHKITEKHLNEKTKTIFQSAFIRGEFLVRNDVLEYDSVKRYWNLYEIKGTNTLDENERLIDHVEDAAFQFAVLEDSGLQIGQTFIIHLNKDYIRGDDIDIKELFTIEEISGQINKRIKTTREKMQLAAEALLQPDEKALECQCLYLGRSNHCSTFNYSHPEVPKYSVHDLARIGSSRKKLASLIDSQIYNIEDISDPSALSEVQQNQIFVHKTQKPLIDLKAIKDELNSLVYPLYFLDYETYPSAIPLFKGFKPYQQIPFQFSLHVLKNPDGKLEHFEYLHINNTDPSQQVIKKLKEFIGLQGNIMVWNKKFEKGINAQLAQRHPEDAEFLNNINERIYDLMEIFQKQLYVHPGFKGKVSIKKVLPVLVPTLSYKELEIQEGGTAMEAWYEMVFGDQSMVEKQAVAKNLLKYCCLDTYAMYMIWKELREL